MAPMWTLYLRYGLQDHPMRRRRPKSPSRKTRLRGAASASSCNGFSRILLLSLWTAAGSFTSIIDVHLSGYWICTFITLCTSRGMFSFVCNRFTAFAHIARVPHCPLAPAVRIITILAILTVSFFLAMHSPWPFIFRAPPLTLRRLYLIIVPYTSIPYVHYHIRMSSTS